MVKKTTSSKPKVTKNVAVKPRQLKPANYKSFRLHKRIKHPKKLPNSFRLFKQSTNILTQNWKVFAGILLIYGILDMFLVRGFDTGIDLEEVKMVLEETFQKGSDRLLSGIALFGVLLGTNGGATSATGDSYQFLLILVVSLALVWALRQVHSGAKIKVREAFYKGMYPVIPMLLVLIVICFQLIPLLIGSTVYNIVVSTGVAITGAEKILWAILFFLTALLSVYMVTSSTFALYIVTLPDMTPMGALRSARQLVLHRRWSVMRKVLFLPVALLLIGALLIIPLIIFAAPVAIWAFFVFTTVSLALTHSYLYTLYRELL